MKVNITVNIKPFNVPNFVVSKESDTDGAAKESYPLHCLDIETIEKLCDDFKIAVFNKAGLPMPPTCKEV